MIYEKIVKESQELDIKIQELETQIRQLPEGKLICATNGNGHKWYRSDGHHSQYLPKIQRDLAEKLAYKNWLSLQLKNMLREKTAINFYLRHHDEKAYESEQSLVNSSGYKDLLAPYFKCECEEFEKWKSEPYDKNTKHLENLIFSTHSGNKVRSKSEVMIDMLLFQNKIPFRYECLLELDDIAIYPDFTIRHPKTGQIYYWEHFGMMDNPTYGKNVCTKLQTYISHGIIPSIQLITTYETKENPLNVDVVEKIICHYFLS